MRILIVDDQEPVRRGMRSLLASRTEWSVCGEAPDGRDAVAKVKELRPDVVLMDVSMPAPTTGRSWPSVGIALVYRGLFGTERD